MTRVLHTAQALVDITIEVPELPTTGYNVNASSLPVAYAGGAVNILVAAARTGAQAVHGGAHGEGRNGDLIRAALQAESVTLSSPQISGKDSGSCYVFVEPSAERSFITCYGAERDITVGSLNTLKPADGDLLCISGYSLFEPTREPLLEFLHQVSPGVLRVLDPGDAFAQFPLQLREQMMRMTEVWTSNLAEAEAISGESDPLAAVEKIYGMLVDLREGEELSGEDANPEPVVIVRNGPAGCYLKVDSAPGKHFPGFPQKPVDTNGAGDTHTGILLGFVSQGLSWEDSAKLANAGAALKVTRRGPATAPKRAEIEEFLARWEANDAAENTEPVNIA